MNLRKETEGRTFLSVNNDDIIFSLGSDFILKLRIGVNSTNYLDLSRVINLVEPCAINSSLP